jgi:hypothetical protein
VCIIIGFAALGALATAGAGTEPGALLGAFLVVGTIIGGLAVQPRGVYLIIPAPALCYVVTAVMAGLIHDRATDSSKTVLAVNGAQWVASGFIAMCIATILAILLTAIRWPRKGRSRRRDAEGDWHPRSRGGSDDWSEPEPPARSPRRSALRD